MTSRINAPSAMNNNRRPVVLGLPATELHNDGPNLRRCVRRRNRGALLIGICFVVCLVLASAAGRAEDTVQTDRRTPARQTVSEIWAAALATAAYDDLAPDVIDKVVLTLADCVGVMTYNAGLDEVRRFHSVTATGGRAEATELVTGRRVPLAQAAAINAFAIHGHEIDDSNLRNQLRASCVAVPAPLATLYQPYRPVQDDYRKKFDRLTARLAPDAREKLWRHVMNVKAAKDVSQWCRELTRLMWIPTDRIDDKVGRARE